MKKKDTTQNLKPFKKGHDPRRNMKGRPPSILTKIAASIGREFSVTVPKDDMFKMLQMMLELSKEELQQIVDDPQSPAFMVSVANAIVTDIKKGEVVTVNGLFDRLFGRPEQTSKMELTGKDGGPVAIRSDLSWEEEE